MANMRRTQGDGSFYQRADGMWVGSVELPSLDGKRRRKVVIAKDRNQAITKLKKARADIDAGNIAVTSNTTISKWLERWLNEIHGTELRPTTFRDYETTIRLYINPHIGGKRLDRLTPEHVRQMTKAIPSGRSAQKAYVVLKRALDDAIGEGMLTRNVAKAVHTPKHTAAQREPLTVEQAKKLLTVSLNLKDPMHTRWAAALLLGARQGELLGLEWDRVDLTTGVVDLSWQLQQLQKSHGCGERHSDGTWPCGKVRMSYCTHARWAFPRGYEHRVAHNSLVLTRPKSKAGTRIVPIPPHLWSDLEAQAGEGFVWHQNGNPISPRDDYDNWQAALSAADLPPAPLHVARHTTASLLLAAGVPEPIMMEILGHSAVAATRGYAHADMTLRRQSMTSLNELLAQPLKDS